MPVMAHEGAIEPMQVPALRPQPHAEIEFLVPMKIAVGQIADLLDRLPPIETAAVHPIDRTETILRRFSAHAPRELEIGDVHLPDVTGDAGAGGIGLKISDRRSQKIWIKLHIAVHQADQGPGCCTENQVAARSRSWAACRHRVEPPSRGIVTQWQRWHL